MGPPAAYERLRRECPVARIGGPSESTGWYVTRYADVKALIADGRLIRPTIDEWPPGPDREPAPGPKLTTMMELEGPAHRALRRALGDVFSARSVRGRLPDIRRAAARLLADFAADGPPGDLIAGFTEPFPLLVMCELTGIPYEDREYYLPLADAALGAMVTLEEGRAAVGPLHAYLADLIARKRRTPAEDVLSLLVRCQAEGSLDEEGVLAFGLSMLVAGYRTTTMFLSDAVLALLEEPGAYGRLAKDRRELPAAVEEFLRYVPVMNGVVVLLATEDITLHGHTIRAGEAVLPVLAAANRDPEVFPEADRLVLDRQPNPHLAFGRGVHNCVGSHLARAELSVGLSALLDRFPGLRIAEGRQPTWDDASPSKSPLTLPVSW
ncbi:cytochrome P450 [Streptomyces sp. MST-110588]|nr:cytochrome P450 [Streptomyces sp. MST-110588]